MEFAKSWNESNKINKAKNVLDAKYCQKCSTIFAPNFSWLVCPSDGEKLDELTSLTNYTIAGKYLLGKVIGSGSFGTVYAAKNQELGNKVAVKVLSAKLYDGTTRHVNRFKREMQKLALVEHAAVARVVDCGLSPKPFIVMDLVEGKSLSETLKKEGRLPEQTVYKIAKRLAETLAYSHGLNLAHQDLEPQSIFITNPDPHQFDIRILDFGVANLLDLELLFDETNEAFGNPAYMAPERFSSSSHAKPSADIYALGCIVYECLTGRQPFKGNTYIELGAAHSHVRPIFQEEDKFGKLGKELSKIILHCLAKNPDDRPSAEKLLDSLNNIFNQKKASSQDIKVPSALATIFKEKPYLGVSILSILLILLGTVIGIEIMVHKGQATKNLGKLEDNSKSDLITSLAAKSISQIKMESSTVTVEKDKSETKLQLYVPEEAKAIITVLSYSSKDSELLGPIFKAWSERGFLVAVAHVSKSDSDEKISETIAAIVKDVSKNDAFSTRPPSGCALVSLRMNLGQTLAASKNYSKGCTDKMCDLSAVLTIDPVVSKEKTFEARDYHECHFPLFFVLDSDVNHDLRPETTKQCQSVFAYGAGKQVFYNSSRVSLLAKPVYR
ncbi:MAG: serine/threonine protein kinase, partial [Candidatus Obscuribacterales bacterium]|nr:serine/threonine protein kinase [Candidatus Obscuribacterales bacterium]